MIDRREFIKRMTAGSLGISFLHDLLWAGQIANPNSLSPFTNNLTTFAVIDDVISLAFLTKSVPLPLITYFHSDYNIILPGNMLHMGWLVGVTEEKVWYKLQAEKSVSEKINRELTQAERENPDSAARQKLLRADKKVALMLGWYLACGIRDVLWPVWSAAGNDRYDMMVYHDMAALKGIAESGSAADKEIIRSFFEEMAPRMITRTHTLTPDYDDGPAWTIRISGWRSDTMHLLEQYAAAYADPEAAKTKAYLSDIHFYNPEDVVIRTVREKQTKDVSELGTPQSLYGKALLKGLESLVEVGNRMYPTGLTHQGQAELPESLRLKGNYPNPFNNATIIRFDLPETSEMELIVTNVLGQVVYTSNRRVMPAGPDRQLRIDAENWPSGTYYYQLIARSQSTTDVAHGKITLLK